MIGNNYSEIQHIVKNISNFGQYPIGAMPLIWLWGFKVVNRAAREGRNPSTGEKIHIPASKAVKFTPGANLKERVNK